MPARAEQAQRGILHAGRGDIRRHDRVEGHQGSRRKGCWTLPLHREPPAAAAAAAAASAGVPRGTTAIKHPLAAEVTRASLFTRQPVTLKLHPVRAEAGHRNHVPRCARLGPR